MRICIIILLAAASYHPLPAQPNNADTLVTPISGPAENLKEFYSQQRGDQAAVYTGIFHYSYPSDIEGYAYYLSPDWQKGELVYAGIYYKNVLMKYDLVKDQVIITTNETGGMPIGLYRPRVSRFAFSGNSFVWMDKRTDVLFVQAGFYRHIVSGKVTVWARNIKLISEKVVDNRIARKFEETAKFYFLKEGQYYLINSKKELIKVLQEHKKEIQGYIRQNKFKYRLNPEKMIVAVSRYYNQL